MPLVPELIVAPPVRLTVTVPLLTDNCVVARFPSTSFTLTPVIDSATSSLTVCAPGTVFTSASFTAVTVTTSPWAAVVTAVAVPSLLVAVTPRLIVPLKSTTGVIVSAFVICAAVSVHTPPPVFVPADSVAPVGTPLIV